MRKKILLKYGYELEVKVPASKWLEFQTEINPVGTLASDSSIRHTDLQKAVEVRSNVGGKEYITKLTNVLCRTLEKNQATVDQSCGYHLHISSDRFFVKTNINRIVFLWCAIEDVMFSTQPKSRYNNTYCRRKLIDLMDTSDWEIPTAKKNLINYMGNYNRYFALNLEALRRHGTIEIRLHAGTINAEKIKMWIELMTAFFNYAILKYNHKEVLELFHTSISTEKIARVFDVLGLKTDVKQHFFERISKFGFERMAEEQQIACEFFKALPSYKKKLRMRKILQEQIELEKHKLNEIRNKFQRPTQTNQIRDSLGRFTTAIPVGGLNQGFYSALEQTDFPRIR